MRAFELIVSSWIALAPAATQAALVAPAEDQEADLTEARRLFDQGIARYEAADYEGAIEVFTLALGEVRGQGVNDFAVRGLLLFNIGRSHMRAYEIDEDIEHLRQAQAIFQRFLEEAETYPDEVDETDVAEAREQLAEIDEMLATDEDAEVDPVEGPGQPVEGTVAPQVGEPGPSPNAGKVRARGIGLTTAGVALLGGGVGMLVWGLGYGPAAESKVAGIDELGLPDDSPAFAAADDFVAQERRKGTTWMAAGGATAALGVVGVAIGIQQLVLAKRLAAGSVGATASFNRDGVWFGVHGRF